MPQLPISGLLRSLIGYWSPGANVASSPGWLQSPTKPTQREVTLTSQQTATANREPASRRASAQGDTSSEAAAPEALATRRRARERKRIAEIKQRDPLQRRILAALYRNPATPTEVTA